MCLIRAVLVIIIIAVTETKEEGYILAYGLRGFRPWLLGPMYMAEYVYDRRELFTSGWTRSRESIREEPGILYTKRPCPAVTYFL